MGLSVDEGVGPRFHQPLRAPADFDRLRDPVPRATTWATCSTRSGWRGASSRGRVPLIGFAGAPWTLMSYMVEGQGSKAFTHAKRLLVQEPARAHALLERLARAVGAFLVAQVRGRRAGGAALRFLGERPGPARFPRVRAALSGAKRCGSRAGRARRSSPSRRAPGGRSRRSPRRPGADVIGVDWQTDAADARRRLARPPVALQGNLDPCWLYAPPATIRDAHARDARRVRRPGAHRQPRATASIPTCRWSTPARSSTRCKEWRAP